MKGSEGRSVERDRYQQLKRIFRDASELAGEAREEFLEQACAGDEEMRHDALDLLLEHEALRRADREHSES